MGLGSFFSWIPFVGDAVGNVVDESIGFLTGDGNVSEWAENTFNPNKNAQKYTDKNSAFNAEQAKLQRDWSAEEAEKSRQFDTQEREAQQAWQEKMIQQQNEYNSPLNQVKLMQAAGLSPVNFDGQVSNAASPAGVPSGSSVGVPSGSTASAAPSHSSSPSSILQPMLEVAQLNLLNKQADAIGDENDRKNDLHPIEIETSKGNCTLIGAKITESEAKSAELRQHVQTLMTQAELMASEVLKNEALTEGVKLDNDGKIIIKPHILEHYVAEINDLNSHSELQLMNAKEVVQHILESRARIMLMGTQAAVNNSQVGLNNAMAGYYKDAADTQLQLGGLYNAQTHSYALPNFLDGLELQFRNTRTGQTNYVQFLEDQDAVTSGRLNLEITGFEGQNWKVNNIDNNIFWLGVREYTTNLGHIMGGNASYGFQTHQQSAPRSVIRGFAR